MPADILVVDDSTETLVAIEATLERLGHNLAFARGGEEALQRCRERDFALVLLDVQLPDMDGFTVAAHLQKLKNPPPIIFLTGLYRDDIHISRGFRTGAVDYLFKPILPEILRSKVEAFVALAKRAS